MRFVHGAAIHLKSWIAAPHKKRGARNDTQNDTQIVSAGIQVFYRFYKKMQRLSSNNPLLTIKIRGLMVWITPRIARLIHPTYSGIQLTDKIFRYILGVHSQNIRYIGSEIPKLNTYPIE